MLVFNCSKTATEFFTCSRKGKKISAIKPAPNKTIAESVQSARIMRLLTNNEVDKNQLVSQETDIRQWHWLVHAIKVKRKNILIVMDYESRFAMTFTGLKKGDEQAFLTLFKAHLKLHINEILPQLITDLNVIENSFAQFANHHTGYVFHQRGDRSVQSHINDVVWHIEMTAIETGDLPIGYNLICFDRYINETLRTRNGDNDYFYPRQAFLHQWVRQYIHLDKTSKNTSLNKLTTPENNHYQSKHTTMFDLTTAQDTSVFDDISTEVDPFYFHEINKSTNVNKSNVIEVDFLQKHAKE